MHNFRFEVNPLLRLILFLIGALIINWLLSFIFIDARQFSRWQQNDLQKQKYDVCILGSSEAACDFDVKVISHELDCQVFNMGGNAINLEHGVMAKFIQLLKYQRPSKIILTLDLDYKEYGIESVEGYGYNICSMDSWPARIYYYLSCAFDGNLISRTFIWPTIVSKKPADWIESIKIKLSDEYMNYDKEIVRQNRYRIYSENGFTPYIDVHNEEFYDDLYDEKNKNSGNKINYDIRVDRNYYPEAVLKMIARMCDINGTELILVVMPITDMEIINSGVDYDNFHKEFMILEKELGVRCIDSNLLKKAFWSNDVKYYYDWHHLNYIGAEKFSKAVCDVINSKGSECYYSSYYDKIN